MSIAVYNAIVVMTMISIFFHALVIKGACKDLKNKVFRVVIISNAADILLALVMLTTLKFNHEHYGMFIAIGFLLVSGFMRSRFARLRRKAAHDMIYDSLETILKNSKEQKKEEKENNDKGER